MDQIQKTLAVVGCSLLVAACGSSSSNNSSTAGDTSAPVISAVTPNQMAGVQSKMVTVQGQVFDESSLKSVVLQIAGNQVDATVDQGRFSAQVALAPGANNYRVIATDVAGNQAEMDGSVYFGRQISAGGSHSGAIEDGILYTWGRNNIGQLGIGKTSSISENEATPGAHPLSPVAITTSTEFVSLAFNQNASLALDENGHVWGWGDGDDGQLGFGDPDDDTVDETDYSVPTKNTALENVVAIARGYDHSMVLKADGTVYSFGDNRYGQLGDGTTDDKDAPVLVNGLSNVVQIAAASAASYAIDDQGRLWGWGRNSSGELATGVEDSDPHSTPVQIQIAGQVVAVAAGKSHALALTSDGQVYGWGLNASSQIGLKESDTWPGEIYTPQLLPWFADAINIWANGNQSFVQRADGKVYPWGQNLLGSLGVEQEGNVEQPDSPIFGLENVADLGVGALHTLAIRNDRSFFSWGWSFEGSLGGGESTIHRWSYRLPIKISLPEVE